MTFRRTRCPHCKGKLEAGQRIQNADGSAITLWQALLRFVVAIGSWLFCGLGFLWVLWDKDKRSWHDIYSESRVVQLPKNIHKK